MEGKRVVFRGIKIVGILLNSLKGKGFGTKDAEIMKNLFIAYLSGKLYSKNEYLGEQEEAEEERYDETFWARQRVLLKEKDKFVSIDEI